MPNRNSTGIFLVLLVSVLPISCASSVIIDDRGVDRATYERDLADCERIAEQVETGKKAGKSALFGAAVFGTLGLITGEGVGSGAAQGAVVGGASGGLDGDREEKQVVKNCLRNRGYKVLN